MAKVNKKTKFQQNMTSPNVIEPGKTLFENIKGNWNTFFENDHEIVLELACGWGEYTLALAEQFPEKNFIGVDIKGDRVWRGSQYALRNDLKNVAFLRIHIIEIDKLFEESEVDEIWLTFPDPRPKEKDVKHRLANGDFLAKYRSILKQSGWFKFKTDNTGLFDYTKEVIKDIPLDYLAMTDDLYNSDLLSDHFGIKTKYEKIWTEKGEKIKYMKFKFK